jgi:hypothetical protein
VNGICSTRKSRVLRRPPNNKRPRGQKPKAKSPQGPSPKTRETTIRAGESRPRADQGGALCLTRWIAQRSLGQHPISPHNIDTIPSVHDAMDGGWRDSVLIGSALKEGRVPFLLPAGPGVSLPACEWIGLPLCFMQLVCWPWLAAVASSRPGTLNVPDKPFQAHASTEELHAIYA